MSPAAGFVPAWKRLGLKLTHFPEGNQSGDPVSGTERLQSTKEHPPKSGRRGSKEDIHQDAEPTENGNPPRLGKRKPLDAPAEDHNRDFKKSRKDQDPEPSHGKAEKPAAESAKEVIEQSDVIHQPSSISDKPKGDTNYRKKKPRGPRQEKATLKHAHTKNQARTARASPGHAQSQVRSHSPGDTDFAHDGATLLPSTETDFLPSQPGLSSTGPRKTSRDPSGEIANTTLDSTPPRTDRRKSVTFTPDTKTSDGNSASNLFKKWVLDQKGVDSDFTEAEVAQFAPPPKIHVANVIPVSQNLTGKEEKEAKKREKKSKKSKKEVGSKEWELPDTHAQHPEKSSPSTAPVDSKLKAAQEASKASTKITPAPKGKKKDPSTYLSYLSQYHNDRDSWKFNKAKQNDVLDNALNIFRIPDKYLEALLEYTKGLKGASVVERLIDKSNGILRELDEEEKKRQSTMDDAQIREAAKQEALEERIHKEKRRRELDGDIEALTHHPFSDGFIRRLKRRRAEALLSALNLAAPIQPPNLPRASGTGRLAVQQNLGPTIASKPVRKRKSRTDVSSDSSSDSSSDDSSDDSSSSSESESGDSDSESKSNAESSSSEEDSSDEDGGSENSGSENGSESSGSEDSGSEDN